MLRERYLRHRMARMAATDARASSTAPKNKRQTAGGWRVPAIIALLAVLAGVCASMLLRQTARPTPDDMAVAMLFAGLMALAWLCPLPFTDKTKLYLDTTVTF